MASETDPLHIFFFPLMAPGHMIPLIDMARLFATRGVKSTIITTTHNASRFQSTIDRDRNSGLSIQFHALQFPCSEANLPEKCENVDNLPSRDLTQNFTKATMLLQPQFDHLVQQHLPDAIITDLNFPWTTEIAVKCNIPRIIFRGSSCFPLSVTTNLYRYMPHANVTSDSEPFLVPGLPDPVYVTKAKFPDRSLRHMGLTEFFQKVRESDRNTYATVVNSFDELEGDYVEHYKKATGQKAWTVGPVSLCNIDSLSKSERGNKASVDEDRCLAWLDSQKSKSVLYVCLGSLCLFTESQLMEIGLGLEASNHPFIWVIRDTDTSRGSRLLEKFEERVAGRGLVIRGWAPQVLILSHSAIGGFMTHCGWNSVLESVSAGLPMITWPLFAEQFYNEWFVLNLMKIGIGIGVERGFDWGEEEEIDVLVNKKQVEEAVTRLLSASDEEVKDMRKRAIRLSELAKSAVEEGGSSYVNMGLVMEDLMNKRRERLGRA